ncbi:MAG: peptide chain release factor 1 [Alphaproteobacteria bacterium]|nr:peptide chain release factor 1 [Alphaproteobacteria bacterium]MCD8563209.1 peptide chain release factor 1 [Alphaproteobacteria bacterium]
MSIQEKLSTIRSRSEELSALMSAGNLNGEQFTKLSKEYAELAPIVEAMDSLDKAREEKTDLQSLLSDPEMKEIAAEELKSLNERIPELEKQVKLALIPKDVDDDRNAILEIRAGTGGDEAALFAADLFGMYRGYAARMGWKFNVVEASESDLGGYKEIIVEISGQNVFRKLKYESGGHRVQRVPKTESGGRIHTSAATVAVLAEAEEVDVDINPADLRIDTYRSQGAGGQHVNTTDSAVRIVHVPTGIMVEMQEERSQHKNREKAMRIIRTRLYDAQRQKLADERAKDRKEQVGSGDRSERVRTYNFPQGRVTDHRINLTLYKIDEVMNGSALHEIVDSLEAEDNAAALAELE